MSDKDRIELMGGTAATARLCGVSMAVVTNWKKYGIPKGWRKFLTEKRPDVFEQKAAA